MTYLCKVYMLLIDFSKHAANWFQSYLSNRSFLINLGNNFSQPVSAPCVVPQGSILGPILFYSIFNICEWHVTSCQMWSFSICRYTCLVCKHKDINKIENQLDKDFCNICD